MNRPNYSGQATNALSHQGPMDVSGSPKKWLRCSHIGGFLSHGATPFLLFSFMENPIEIPMDCFFHGKPD